jgi:ABC-type polysaccharide/polyol phosphate transport system ATPase subunit
LSSRTAVSCERVWKTFRIPYDRPSTIKQRALHPLRSYAARELDAVKDVTFAIEEGEFFGVIGANGSGKSTLLKCLAGIYQPDRGEIVLTGRVSPFIELGVGFNGELPALDNVVINAALLGMAPGEARRRFPDVISFAELEEFTDLKLKNYSSGMQVRLAFSAAIQADADVHLVDEVLAVGDIRFQEKCFEVFRQFKRDGRTVVFVTHDMSAVERFCDRALLLHHGAAVAIGKPRDVMNEYRALIFGQEEGREPEQAEEQRWGDRTAEVVEAWIEDGEGNRVTALTGGDWYRARLQVVFNERHEHPVFGLVVRSESGFPVFLTSSFLDGHAPGVLEPGDVVVYSVTFQALLAHGRYVASPYVAYQDQMRYADSRENLVTFNVRTEVQSGGVVDLPHSSTVQRVPITGSPAAP